MTATTGARTLEARTARSRRTRAALVSAVRAELRTRGSFSADDVAARAGCSPATFYSHFASKPDAMTAAFEQTLDDLVALGLELLTVDRFVDDGIPATIAAVVDEQAAFYHLESLVFRASLSALPEHQPLREIYRAAERRTLAHLVEVFGELQRRHIVAATDIDQLAETFLVALQGVNNPRATRPSAGPIRAGLARGLAAILDPPTGDEP